MLKLTLTPNKKQNKTKTQKQIPKNLTPKCFPKKFFLQMMLSKMACMYISRVPAGPVLPISAGNLDWNLLMEIKHNFLFARSVSRNWRCQTCVF